MQPLLPERNNSTKRCLFDAIPVFQLSEDPYVTDKNLGDCALDFPYKVPRTGYFVLGARRSRSNSVDSRNSVVGTLGYMNHAEVDDQQVDGWASFNHGQAQAGIINHGAFHGDAEGGAFVWEFQVTIPGLKEGQKADCFWFIMGNCLIPQSLGS